MSLVDHLNKPSIEQLSYAKDKCFDHFARVLKNGNIHCLECGHNWNDKIAIKDNISCPNCEVKLKVKVTRKQKFTQYAYFSMLNVVDGYQVVRIFYAELSSKIGKQAHYFINEIVQHWIIDDKKTVIVARCSVNCFWSHCSNLEIRRRSLMSYSSVKYNIIPSLVCPGWQVLPKIRRNGFKGNFYCTDPLLFFKEILTDTIAETLLKCRQYRLLRLHVNSSRCVTHWRSICICIRNKYKVKDASMWCDYVDLLRYFGKDVNNPIYICPKNLKAEHDKYVEKKKVCEARKQLEAQMKKALRDEARFKELKSIFFGVSFTDGHIQLKVLESIQEFIEEGLAMHHCVSASEYYLKPDSLILSATIEGKRIETVELSLKTLEVIQSRGVCNRNTEYHSEIINLMRKNIGTIKKLIAV